jgi:3-deoxy-D-manno-octulosonic-acid transferase
MRISGLTKPVLENLEVLSMISAADAERICRMGADKQRVRIGGNAKYDGLVEQASARQAEKMESILRLGGNQPVLVAGSVRGAELAPVLDAFCRIRQRLPDAVLVAAPRHMENAAPLSLLATKRGLTVQRRSELNVAGAERSAAVVVLDTIGELMATYGAASVVFCGGSLAPLGGQNILEPAAWGKPVLYGPSTEDFSDAREILEREGGGVPVADAGQLAEKALYYLTHRDAAVEVGRRARAAAASQSGAGRRHAEVILELLADLKQEEKRK